MVHTRSMVAERVSRVTRSDTAVKGKGKTGASVITRRPDVFNASVRASVGTRAPVKHTETRVKTDGALQTTRVEDNKASTDVARNISRKATTRHGMEEIRSRSPDTFQTRIKVDRVSVIINYRQKPLSGDECILRPSSSSDHVCDSPSYEEPGVQDKSSRRDGSKARKTGMASTCVMHSPSNVTLSDFRMNKASRIQRPKSHLEESKGKKKSNMICEKENVSDRTKPRIKGKAIGLAISKKALSGSKRHREESESNIESNGFPATDPQSRRRVRQKSAVRSERKSYDTRTQTQADTVHRTVCKREGPVVPHDGSTIAEDRHIDVREIGDVVLLPMDIRRSTRLAHGVEKPPSYQPPSFVREKMTGGSTRTRARHPRIRDSSRRKSVLERDSIGTPSCCAIDLDSATFVRLGDLSSPPVSEDRHSLTSHWHLRIDPDLAS
ncbi:hypothetical protein ACEPAI_1818 [Sanghuangporus weigelae]